MATATRESSHSGTSSMAMAAGESQAFPGPWYKMSGDSRSSGEEQPSHPPLDICAWEEALLSTGNIPSVATWKILCFPNFKEPLWL